VFLRKVGTQIDSLSAAWHTFNLNSFERKPREILDDLKRKSSEIRKKIRRLNWFENDRLKTFENTKIK